ncbi:MAG TPA: hypothetical protein PJ984_02840 [Candidatus Saccharibacteria bacterium]|jgi:hypothetical protein|nr:hypothetical protein [Candidatus Saccharibacteria bacterium]
MYDSEPTQTSQNDKNYELLRQSELGVLLTRAYIGAVNHDLRLCEVNIVDLDENSNSTAFARPKWGKGNTSGRHEVHIRNSNLDEVLDHYKKELAVRPAVVARVADMLGINRREVTPQLFHVFTMLHELGHVSDFFDHEDDPEAYAREIRKARLSLPLGYLRTSKILDPKSDIHRKILAHRDELFTMYKVDTLDDLLALHHDKYRDMPHEKHADYFAVEVLELNPTLLDQLSRDTVEPYRNYPGFGQSAA